MLDWNIGSENHLVYLNSSYYSNVHTVLYCMGVWRNNPLHIKWNRPYHKNSKISYSKVLTTNLKIMYYHNCCLYINLIGAWLSLVERCVRDAEVASSNLVAPILRNSRKAWFYGLSGYFYVRNNVPDDGFFWGVPTKFQQNFFNVSQRGI